MNRSILILIFVSILLAGCITSEPADKGTLQLTSSPTGAEIYFDNQYRGTTPSTISEIEPGNHTLEVRSDGYTNWKSLITVPSGISNYVVALTTRPGSEQGTDVTPVPPSAPVDVSVRVSREQMIVGDSNLFSGTATGTGIVTLTLFGPGYYANGIVLDKINPDVFNAWSYTWNPGSKIQSGTYTLIVYDAGNIVSDRVTFTVIGNGIVSVSTSRYAVANGESIVISGRCTTGAPNVRVVLFGPDRFATGFDLGTVPVMADQMWSFAYTTDITMPTGIYSVSVSDVPQTATASSQFTIGYSS